MDITKYIRTDLAAESGAPTADQKERERHEGDGYLWECRPLCEGTELSSLTILNAEGAERFGRECGRYITLSFGDIWLLGDEEKSALCRQLTFQLLQLAQASAPNYRRVLVCGLGNRDLTTDAIGPLTVRSLQVNRHILPPEEPAPRVELSAFCPGVLGQTGIESADLILAAVQHVRPDLVILLDALAARDEARLARTVQLSDTGLAPGSGIGNHRRPLNRDTLGVPVIAMGVPTVVSSATLICGALEKAGLCEIPAALEQVLETGKSFFVSLKEADVATSQIAELLASALNRAFSAA